ncbi:MAG: FtsQ-type POTRA domain-containing protein [Saccharofermentans sp.]|nr:FtsQ-type POTRA domain-containing protein [Saccharofermentans sp.]
MDDNELDRLFGNDSEPESGALDDENKGLKFVPESDEEDEASGGEPDALFEDAEDDLNDEAAEEDTDVSEDAEPEESDEELVEEPFEEPDEKADTKPERSSASGIKRNADKQIPASGRKPPVKRKTSVTVDRKSGDGNGTFKLTGRSVIALVLIVIVIVMVAVIAFHPAFRVRNVHIEGNVALSEQEVLDEAGLKYNAHLMSGVSGNIIDILCLDYGKTEKQIMSRNPYVEDIRITIKLPSTVNISIRERQKICYVRTPDGYAALDKDGIVLELSSFDSQKNVRPVICGLNIKYAELGEPVEITNTNDYKKAIIVLGAILAADNASVGDDYSMFANTSEVRMLPSGYIFLTIYSPSGHPIQIKLNSLETISDDMAWLLYAFNGDAFDKVSANGALDMTNDEYIFKEY